MRIALVSDCYLPQCGGIEVHVHDLGLALRRAGHEVVVLTTTDGSDGSDELSDVPVLRFRTASDGHLARVLASDSFDVVHAHSSLVSPLAWSAVRLATAAGLPTVATMHSLPPPLPAPVGSLLHLALRLGPQVRWTAVSEVAAAVLRPMVPAGRVDVLHNGIDPVPWRRAARVRRSQPLTLVSTGRLVRRKRPVALIRTLAEIRRQVPPEVPLRAVVIGDGPRRASVERTARRLGMSSWVDLPGRLTRPEIQRIYSQADVYLAPARLESFGIAALEARCAGLPVVAMSSGGVGEFVRSGVEGFLADDDEALASATVAMLTQPALLRSMQAYNRATVPAMSWDIVIDQHLRAYASAGAPSVFTLTGYSQPLSAVLPA